MSDIQKQQFGSSPILDLRSQTRRDRDKERELKREAMRVEAQKKLTQNGAPGIPPPPSNGEGEDVVEEPKFDYSQPVKKVPHHVLSEPQLYGIDDDKKGRKSEVDDATVIVVILSARSNVKRRKAIRETWGNNHAVYFVVGGPTRAEQLELERRQKEDESKGGEGVEGSSNSPYKTEIQQQLEREQTEHRDILDSFHPDSYRSLPYKVKFAYKWVLQNLPQTRWIVKVDDDTVVRVDTLRTAFLRNFNWEVPMVVGRIIERSPVAREGKWADFDYKPDYYPYWPQGSCGHVLSRAVAEYIANLEKPKYYQGEDVSIGIWLDEAPPDDLHVTWVHSNYFRNDRKCLHHAWLIMGHEVTEDEMRECYEQADEWPIEDVRHHHRRYWKVETLQQRKEYSTSW